jgi:hypothetical protein
MQKKNSNHLTCQSYAVGEQYVYLLDIEKMVEKKKLKISNPYNQTKDAIKMNID